MRFRFVSLLLLAAAATPAAAQSSVEGRVGKLEGEMRAVQRKVFPGGNGALIEPQITPAAPTPSSGPGTPATDALADLTERVSSLEGQMRTLTGQIEQNQYQLKQLQDAFDAYRRRTDAKLDATPPALSSTSGDEDAPAPARRPAAASDRTVSSKPAAPVARDPGRTDQVAQVEKPASGDAAEDAYLYGYRLWQAKLYPEAEAQLKSVVTDFPKHRRASYAQNLLGRAYLDEGKPSLASIAFYDNYKKYPEGERAPDSLNYLAQALIKLNKPADACKVYGELTDVYGAKIGAGMQADIARGRTTAKCK